jgi:hypothetical protein
MRTRVWFLIALTFPAVAAGAYWFRGSLNAERRPARETRALAIGYELRNTTNSTKLIGADPKFRADLASILGGVAWNLIDRSPPRDAWAVVRLIITNDQGQALRLSLKDEYPSERLRLLSYRRIIGPDTPEAAIKPAREANPALPSTGSDR